jgi:chromate transporter
MPPPPSAEPRPAPSLAALFLGFASISALGFGGVLPWVRRLTVERRGWLSPAEFTDLLALCQFLPGPNVINLAVSLGGRYHGAKGAAAALAGMLALPLATVIALGALYGAIGSEPLAVHTLHGLAAAASGLVAATALKIAGALRGRPPGLGIAAVAFVAIAVLRLPLVPTMLVLAPLSILLHWRVA